MSPPPFPRAREASPPDRIPRETDRVAGADLPSTVCATAMAFRGEALVGPRFTLPRSRCQVGISRTDGIPAFARRRGAKADNRPTNCETDRSARSPAAGLRSSRDISFSLRSSKGYREKKAGVPDASGENEFASRESPSGDYHRRPPCRGIRRGRRRVTSRTRPCPNPSRRCAQKSNRADDFGNVRGAVVVEAARGGAFRVSPTMALSLLLGMGSSKGRTPACCQR